MDYVPHRSHSHEHLVEQHPVKWNDYQEVFNDRADNEEAFSTFFSQTKITAFFPTESETAGRKQIYIVSKPIVDVVVRDMLFDDEDRAGDIAMKMFEPVFSESDSGHIVAYSITIYNGTQFRWIVGLLSAGSSLFTMEAQHVD